MQDMLKCEKKNVERVNPGKARDVKSCKILRVRKAADIRIVVMDHEPAQHEEQFHPNFEKTVCNIDHELRAGRKLEHHRGGVTHEDEKGREETQPCKRGQVAEFLDSDGRPRVFGGMTINSLDPADSFHGRSRGPA